MRRYWINQPSTLQPDHHLHGTNVLCDMQDEWKGCVTIYFTSGPIISQRMQKLHLSRGWRPT